MTMIPSPITEEQIQEVAALYASGKGFKYLARMLNDSGIPAKDWTAFRVYPDYQKWGAAGVSKMLKDRDLL